MKQLSGKQQLEEYKERNHEEEAMKQQNKGRVQRVEKATIGCKQKAMRLRDVQNKARRLNQQVAKGDWESKQWENETDMRQEALLRAGSVWERFPVLISSSVCEHPQNECPFSWGNSSKFFATGSPFLESSALKTFLKKIEVYCSLLYFWWSQLQIPGSQAFTLRLSDCPRLPQQSLYFPFLREKKLPFSYYLNINKWSYQDKKGKCNQITYHQWFFNIRK